MDLFLVDFIKEFRMSLVRRSRSNLTFRKVEKVFENKNGLQRQFHKQLMSSLNNMNKELKRTTR